MTRTTLRLAALLAIPLAAACAQDSGETRDGEMAPTIDSTIAPTPPAPGESMPMPAAPVAPPDSTLPADSAPAPAPPDTMSPPS